MGNTDFILPIHNKINLNICRNDLTLTHGKLFKPSTTNVGPDRGDACVILPTGTSDIVTPLMVANR